MLKDLNFDNFDNSSYDQNISVLMWKMDLMSGFGIRLVFTLPPRDSTLQSKDAYTSEMTFLAL